MLLLLTFLLQISTNVLEQMIVLKHATTPLDHMNVSVAWDSR